MPITTYPKKIALHQLWTIPAPLPLSPLRTTEPLDAQDCPHPWPFQLSGKPSLPQILGPLGATRLRNHLYILHIFYKMFFLLTWESSWPSLPPKVESPRIPQDPSGSGTRISMPSGKGPTTCGTRCHVLVAELWRIRGKHLNYISIWLLRLESELHIFAKEFLIGTIPQLMLAWRFGLVVWKSGNSWFYEPNYFNCLIKAWKNRLINNINNTKTAKNNKCQTNL